MTKLFFSFQKSVFGLSLFVTVYIIHKCYWSMLVVQKIKKIDFTVTRVVEIITLYGLNTKSKVLCSYWDSASFIYLPLLTCGT